MKDMIEKLKSRKFQITLASIGIILLSSLVSGHLSGDDLNRIVAVALGYLGVEGAVDYQKAKNS
jgi:hypothetical protein